jgi:hypothetical protein
MRRIRIVLGLASAVCAFGVLAAPALAKKEKEPVMFGKFTASIPGKTISPAEPASTRGKGGVTEINLAGTGLIIKSCEKALKSTGMVESESSETFLQNITFSKCKASISLNKSPITAEETIPPFTLGMEFHSNKSVVLGEAGESEVKVVRPSNLSIKIGKTPCVVEIPSQTIPVKAEKKPEGEYEAASYETTKEPAKLKKFPSGFQEKLNIEMEFKKVESYVKPAPGCTFNPEGGKVNKEAGSPREGDIEFDNGTMELELEEISIKHGNVGFEPKKEG